MDGAVEIAGLREGSRGPEQHRCMTVMTATMEAAGNGRAPAQVGVLFHRNGVHIGPEPAALGTGALALEPADNAGAAEAAMHFNAPLLHLFGDDAGSAD